MVVAHAGLATLLPRDRANNWTLNLCQLGSRRAQQAAVVATTRRQRTILEHERRKSARFERAYFATYDTSVVVSDADRQASGAGATVPNGVDTSEFQPSPLPVSETIVMTGSLNTAANVDAATWLCREVLPLVRRDVPGAAVDIVGKSPTAEVCALSALEGVRVHADVPDVRPFLAGARTAVVPVRIGSGSRLKALEAMAAGRPLVGTSVGLEGVGAVHGDNALVADGAAAMASALARVLRDDDLARGLADRGRRHAVESYDWRPIAAAFIDLVLR